MKQTKIKLAIVDDHKLFRDGMISLLSNYNELSINIVGSGGVDFFEKIGKSKRPIDILLLDLEMPEMDGMEVLKKLRLTHPEIKSLILTMHNENELIYKLVQLGAKGFLQKNAEIEEVIKAIHTLSENELYFNADISKRVIEKLVKKEQIRKISLDKGLTQREKEIVRLICSEHTTKEIGEMLCISDRTVESHKKNIFDKTKSKNSAGVVVYAMKNGIVELI